MAAEDGEARDARGGIAASATERWTAEMCRKVLQRT